MRRSAYLASLAALLAGTAVAGPQRLPRPAAPPPSCCADDASADPRAADPAARTRPAERLP